MDSILAHYAALKLELLRWSGFSDGMMHMQAGLLLFLATAVAARRPFGAMLPLAAVVAAAAANELADRLVHGSWRSANSAHDLLFTLLWPLLLWVTSRYRLLHR